VQTQTSLAACGAINNNINGGAIGQADNGGPAVTDVGDIMCQKPALSIVKTPDGATIDAGAIAEFTIVVSNSNAAGTGTAKNVTVTDQLPAGYTWTVSQQPAPGTCTIDGSNLMTCTGLGDLAAGASKTIKVQTQTTFAACGVINNNLNGGANGQADNGGPAVTSVGLNT
jgi:uncharacterized repeat protein (TIGR01451 family)